MQIDQLTATLRRSLDALKADPLASIKLVPKQRAYIEAVAKYDETALRAANKFGKSTDAAFIAVALLQGRHELDGVALPRLRRPAVGWALTRTYKQQVEGTQAAIALALGQWPHNIAWENRAEGIWSAVWIKPVGHTSDNWETWAKLSVMSQHSSRNNADNAKGARLDFVWFDEPGYPAVVRELRKAGRPGWPFRIMHTFTPIHRAEWLELRDDIERPGSHIKEIVASIYDAGPNVVNGFLTAAEIKQLERFYIGDPHRLARLQAAYCDVAGASLFENCMDEVLRMVAACEGGEPHAVGIAQRQGQQIAWPTPHPQGGLRVWRLPHDATNWLEEDDIGIVVADPSSGVKDPDKSDHMQPRNPAGLMLGSVKHRAIAARYVGYTNAHELAIMARALCNRCHRWVMVHESNGGWGETFIRSFRESPAGSQGSLWYDRDAKGKYASEAGWNQTHARRGELVAALQRAVSEGGITIWSRPMLENLLQVRLNQNERWDQGDGKGPHGEDLIMAGIFCNLLERGGGWKAGERVKLAAPASRAAPVIGVARR